MLLVYDNLSSTLRPICCFFRRIGAIFRGFCDRFWILCTIQNGDLVGSYLWMADGWDRVNSSVLLVHTNGRVSGKKLQKTARADTDKRARR
jgi:hypothetical protein